MEFCNYFLKDSSVISIDNTLVSLNYHTHGAIEIVNNEDGLFINSPYGGEYMTMATMDTGTLVKDSLQPLNLRSRYVIGNLQMVLPKPVIKGVIDVVKKPQILTLSV